MATKTITITTEAYQRLATVKGANESFSDVINKITRKYSLLDLVGVLSNKEAKELVKSREDINKRLRKEIDKIASRLQ